MSAFTLSDLPRPQRKAQAMHRAQPLSARSMGQGEAHESENRRDHKPERLIAGLPVCTADVSCNAVSRHVLHTCAPWGSCKSEQKEWKRVTQPPVAPSTSGGQAAVRRLGGGTYLWWLALQCTPQDAARWLQCPSTLTPSWPRVDPGPAAHFPHPGAARSTLGPSQHAAMNLQKFFSGGLALLHKLGSRATTTAAGQAWGGTTYLEQPQSCHHLRTSSSRPVQCITGRAAECVTSDCSESWATMELLRMWGQMAERGVAQTSINLTTEL